jgi:hypothetical protein
VTERGCYYHQPGPCPDPKFATEHPFLDCSLPASNTGFVNGVMVACAIPHGRCHHYDGKNFCFRTSEAHKCATVS